MSFESALSKTYVGAHADTWVSQTTKLANYKTISVIHKIGNYDYVKSLLHKMFPTAASFSSNAPMVIFKIFNGKYYLTA